MSKLKLHAYIDTYISTLKLFLNINGERKAYCEFRIHNINVFLKIYELRYCKIMLNISRGTQHRYTMK